MFIIQQNGKKVTTSYRVPGLLRADRGEVVFLFARDEYVRSVESEKIGRVDVNSSERGMKVSQKNHETKLKNQHPDLPRETKPSAAPSRLPIKVTPAGSPVCYFGIMAGSLGPLNDSSRQKHRAWQPDPLVTDFLYIERWRRTLADPSQPKIGHKKPLWRAQNVKTALWDQRFSWSCAAFSQTGFFRYPFLRQSPKILQFLFKYLKNDWTTCTKNNI